MQSGKGVPIVGFARMPALRLAAAGPFVPRTRHGPTTGEDIPLAMRIVHVSHDMEVIGRRFSPGEALTAVRDRRGRTYDPELADLFATHGGAC